MVILVNTKSVFFLNPLQNQKGIAGFYDLNACNTEYFDTLDSADGNVKDYINEIYWVP